MDIRNWKKILLQWISKCGFSERTYYNIDQCDIDAFYTKFCKLHKTAQAAQKNNVSEFLKEYYPTFEAYFDDEKGVNSADYVYVFSLLLHFSCVKYPEEYFHDTCQKLSEPCQQCIATFFKELLDCNTIDKEDLRRAIANVAVLNQSTPVSDGTSTSTSSASGSSIYNSVHIDSPLKTPKRLSSANQRISPNTPKTFLLEERTRELYHLRAQLETESYEKGLLEVQIKQNDEKILKLNEENKKLQHQIQTLRSEMLLKNGEARSPIKDNDSQSKKRLCKDLTLKEQEINRLNDILSSLKEEKESIQNKREYANRKIVLSIGRIQELTCKVDELENTLEEKENTIKFLTDSKNDLERFIQETRSNSKTMRSDLNATDYFDTSFAQGQSNSSGSGLGSPENLGCSVVDKQLQEKEVENRELKEELSKIRAKNLRLTETIQELTMKYVNYCDIDKEIAQFPSDNNDDNAENLFVFAKCVDHISKNYNDAINTLKQFEMKIFVMEEKEKEDGKKIDELEKEITVLKETNQSLQKASDKLTRSKVELKEKLLHCDQNLKKLNDQKHDLATNVEGMLKECQSLKNGFIKQENEFLEKIKILQDKCDSGQREIEFLTESNEKLTLEVDNYQNKMLFLEQKLEENTEELRVHSEKVHDEKKQTEICRAAELAVKEEYEKLVIKYEEIMRKERQAQLHLETMEEKLQTKELEFSQIGKDLVMVNEKNAMLEHGLNELTAQSEKDKEEYNNGIRERDERVQAVEAEKNDLKALLMDVQDQLDGMRKHSKNSEEILKNSLEKLCTIKDILELSSDESDILESLDIIMPKIDEVVSLKVEMSEQIEDYKVEKLEYVAQLNNLGNQLKKMKMKNHELLSKHADEMRNVKLELEAAQKQANDYNEFIQDFERAHIKSLAEVTNQLKMEQENYEYRTKVLNERIANLQIQYNCTLNAFEIKVNDLYSQNEKVISELEECKNEQKAFKIKLTDAEKKIENFLTRLQNEIDNKNEIQSRLDESRNLIHEIETKLENAQKQHEIDVENLRQKNEEKLFLELQLKENTELIDSLKQELQQTIEEKNLAKKDVTEMFGQLEKIGEEKKKISELCENTSEQLNEFIIKREQEMNATKDSIFDLEGKLREANAKIAELDSRLLNKENQLSSAERKQIHDEENWRSELEIVIERLSEQTLRLGIYEKLLIQITAILENNAPLPESLIESKFSDLTLLNDIEESHAQPYNLFRKAFKQFYDSTSRLRFDLSTLKGNYKTSCEKIEELLNTNTELSAQMKQHKNEMNELKTKLSEEAEVQRCQLINETKRLTDDLKNLENVNENITGENSKLELKLTELENEIIKLTDSLLKNQKELQEVKSDQVNPNLEETNIPERKELEHSDVNSYSINIRNNQLQDNSLTNEKSIVNTGCKQSAIELLEKELKKLNSLSSTEKWELLQQKTKIEDELKEQIELTKSVETEFSIAFEKVEQYKRELIDQKSMNDDLRKEKMQLLKQLESQEKYNINEEGDGKLVSVDNQGMRIPEDTNGKRIERLALKLGENMANVSRLERENEKLLKSMDAKISEFDLIRREKEALLNENRSQRERIFKFERQEEHLCTKLNKIEADYITLLNNYELLKTSETDVKAKSLKLEKIRDANSEKIRKLEIEVNNADQERVRLNLDIGALNSNICELKKTTSQMEVIKKNLNEANKLLQEYEDLCKSLKSEAEELRERNTNSMDDLSKVTLSLEISKGKCAALAVDMEKLRTEFHSIREEKSHIEEKHKITCDKLNKLTVVNEQIISERNKIVSSLEPKIVALQEDIAIKMIEIQKLRNENETLRNVTIKNNNDTLETATELEHLRTRFSIAEAMLKKEQEITAQLRLDNQILQAKYHECKEGALIERERSEERIKENRLELEGKLEKMKKRMTELEARAKWPYNWRSVLSICSKYSLVSIIAVITFLIVSYVILIVNDLDVAFKINSPPVY